MKKLSLIILMLCCLTLFTACNSKEIVDTEGNSAGGNTENSQESTECAGTEGLAYYLLDDGTYAVSLGTARYLSEVEFPSNHNGKVVTRIVSNQSVFAIPNDYRQVKKITIPDTITHIEDFAFELCVNISEVNLPESLSYIGEKAFYGCTSLTKLILPSAIAYIGNAAFESCPLIECNEYGNALYLGNAINPYLVLLKAKDKYISEVSINEATAIICSCAFYGCSNLTEVRLPDGINFIGASAFGSSGIATINIPDTVKTLEDWTFSSCYKLTNITFGNESQLEEIKSHVFNYCSGLKNIVLPRSLCIIGDEAFSWCGLEGILIPKNVIYIGYNAFCGMDRRLETVYFETTQNWYVTEVQGAKKGIALNSTDLENSDTAILYFTDTYRLFYWYRT